MTTVGTSQKVQIRYLRGWGLSQQEIARKMGLSQQVVSYNLKQFRREFHTSNRRFYWKRVGFRRGRP